MRYESALSAVETPDTLLVTERENGRETCSSRPREKDYKEQTRLYLRLSRLPETMPEEAYLVLCYADRGIHYMQAFYSRAGAASPASAYDDPAMAAAKPVEGYVSTHTGAVRHAVFHLPRPEFNHRGPGGADVALTGCDALLSARVVSALQGEDEQARREIPAPEDVPPLLKLARAPQLVTNCLGESRVPEEQRSCFSAVRNVLPALRRLGMNGAETTCKWSYAETEKGVFDWSGYDELTDIMDRYGLGWLAFFVVGSGYALPEWFFKSGEFTGFICLEHGIENHVPTIFNENQTPYVRRFLREFGRHFKKTGKLLGTRLGPSGCYGESQYPATGGRCGYRFTPMHSHIGWWAGGADAAARYRARISAKYRDDAALRAAWNSSGVSLDTVCPELPCETDNVRRRKDFVDWYIGEMTLWCERFALWTREGLPETPIYQSAGGWGFPESGTDFGEQTRSMTKLGSGIRATNEDESFLLNFTITRLLASAAKFYGVPYGSEPASWTSVRGTMGRLYLFLTAGGEHFFNYISNLIANDEGWAYWLRYAPLLDRREPNFAEAAMLWPTTIARVERGAMTDLYGSNFIQTASELRERMDFDFCDETMIADGALERYRILIFPSRYFETGDLVEEPVLARIDAWVRRGGRVIYPRMSNMALSTVEKDFSVFKRWMRGDTGAGRAHITHLDRLPLSRYADFVYRTVLEESEDPRTRLMLTAERPAGVYVTALQSGAMAALNFTDETACVRLADGRACTLEPYGIAIF